MLDCIPKLLRTQIPIMIFATVCIYIIFHFIFFYTGKLLSRSLKIAHALLNKTFTSKNSSGGPLTGDNSIKPGDRVALVYPNNDPINFMCAFYGCLQAGIVPVPIEVPLTRRDAGLQQVGFLLGSCGIQYALTSDACLKGMSYSFINLD